jgi:eukaryotic-like serine/threonine-protein kinase
MRPERWQRVQELFEEALSREPAERAAYLDDVCGDDTELREEVKSLLSHHEQADATFMRIPDRASSHGFDDLPCAADPLIGEDIAGYRITRRISTGGMGVVYEAEQGHPKRTVALKVVSAGLVSPELLRRFEHEAQILAKLDHPGIAYVFEAGTFDVGHGSQPFFAMEFVKGVPLVEYADAKKLSMRERLGLLARVADAVQHAHQKGVIHRDLKPANILVTEAGEPKVLDFGVARATDADIQATTLRTDIGQIIGTIPYMSPEQVAGDSSKLDTRSDVYAIGVIAYELLAGRLPYDVESTMIHEAVRVIREDDPPPLSSIDKVFRGDIEIIVAKALEKERERRYQTIGDFATDIRRYLDDEPIDARPPSTWYQVSKFTKRNRVLVGAVIAILFVLVAGVVGTSIGLVQAVKARKAEAEQRKLAEHRGKEAETQSAIAQAVNDFLNNDLLAAVAPDQQGRDVSMRTVLGVASDNIEGKFVTEPLVEASIRMTLGNTYMSLGEYDLAEPHLATALALRRTELGEDHPDTLASSDRLALVLSKRGAYAEAEPLCARALETSRSVLGETHERTLSLADTLAILYEEQGRLGDAERLYASILASRRSVLGDRHPNTLAAMGNLAGVYRMQGRYDEAESLLVRVFRTRRSLLGKEHPSTLRSMNNLAAVYDSMGRFTDAEPLYVDALEIRWRVLGEDHPETLESMSNLAQLRRSMGRYDDAARGYARALELQRKVLGENNRDTLGTMSNLALLYMDQRRYEDSEALHVRTLKAREATLGKNHPDTIASMSNLATLYTRMNRTDEAESIYLRLLDDSVRVLGKEHPLALTVMNGLATLYRNQGRYVEAEPLHARAVAGARHALPDGNWRTGLYLLSQGLTLLKLERYDEAEPGLIEAHEVLASALGEEHPKTVAALRALVDLYIVRGAPDDARLYATKMILFRKRASERPDATPTAFNEYAWVLLTCEPADLRDAVTALTAATKANEMSGGTNPGFLDTLALAYHLNGDTAKARETERHAISLLPPGKSPLRSELEARLAEYGGTPKER